VAAVLAPAERLRDSRRSHRLRAPVGVALGIGLATVALRFHDPHDRGSWGFCPFKAVTGWDCPACGGLRAVNDLTHGRIDAAAHSNLAFAIALPFLVGGWTWWFARTWRDEPVQPVTVRSHRSPGLVPVAVAAALAVFTVWRNTPWGTAFHVA
jgi:hypothetical protein